MSKHDKLVQLILSGKSDANVSFDDLRKLLGRYGFREHIKGGHHIFTKNDIAEIINLQSKDGKAKAYQVKQVRDIIVFYKL